HAALAALVDVIFWRLEFVLHEFKLGRIGKIGNRKYRFEYGLKTLVRSTAHRLLHQQELVVGCFLNLDEVRHLRHFVDCPEKLPYALATGKRLRHLFSLDSISAVGAGALPNSRIPSRPSGQASGPSGSLRFGLGPDRYFSPPPLIAATAVSPIRDPRGAGPGDFAFHSIPESRYVRPGIAYLSSTFAPTFS